MRYDEQTEQGHPVSFAPGLSWDSRVRLRCCDRESLQTEWDLTSWSPWGLKTGEKNKHILFFMVQKSFSRGSHVFPSPCTLPNSFCHHRRATIGGSKTVLSGKTEFKPNDDRHLCHLSGVAPASKGRMLVSFSLSFSELKTCIMLSAGESK